MDIDILGFFFNHIEKYCDVTISDSVRDWVTFIVVIVIPAIILLRKKLLKLWDLRNELWRNKKIKDVLIPEYGDQVAEQKYFISSHFTTTPPNNLDDPLEVERVESSKKLIDHLVERVFVEENTTNRYFCILAGAGMGKTTFAVNLVISYINRYKQKTLPFEIKLVSLARRDFAEVLQQIVAPKETILILDALDENADASNDISSFMQKLEDLIQDFRFVILTSRTQFFPTEEDEPKKTSILNLGKDKGNYIYHKMYISPFSEEDVQEFLRKKYKQQKKRKRAKKIVDRCSSLATRPLLLSHIDDLLNSNLIYETLSSIYETLIDVWIKREVRFNKGGDDSELQQRLYDFSLDFALELFYNKDQSTNMRLSRDSYIDFINRKGYNDYNFSGRSLINRDASGTMKFSHKTFYEYFLAKAKIQNPDLEIPIKGYELAWEFYREMVHEEVSKQSIFTLDEDNALVVKTVKTNGFDFRLLSNVYNVKRIYVMTQVLVSDSHFSQWLLKSFVEDIELVDYTSESLNVLLLIPNLKKVTIYKRHFNNSKNYRKCIQNLRSKGVIVDVYIYEITSNTNTYFGRNRAILQNNIIYKDSNSFPIRNSQGKSFIVNIQRESVR